MYEAFRARTEAVASENCFEKMQAKNFNFFKKLF